MDHDTRPYSTQVLVEAAERIRKALGAIQGDEREPIKFCFALAAAPRKHKRSKPSSAR